MNKAHRSIWNSALVAWVAVSENTHARGKKSQRAVALAAGAASLLMLAGPSFAGGDGGGGGFLVNGSSGAGQTAGSSTTGVGGHGGQGDQSAAGAVGGALGTNGANGTSAASGFTPDRLDGSGGGGGGSARTGFVPVTATITAGNGGNGGTGGYNRSNPGGGGGGGGGGSVLATQSFEVKATGSLVGGNGGNGGGVVANTSSLTGAGGGGGAGVLVVPVGGVTITNAGTITGGNGGTGLATRGVHPVTRATVYGGAGGNGEGGALGGTQLGAYAQGGAGIVGSNLTIVNSGTISGGLAGDKSTRANSIQLGGGNNSLTLKAGSVLNGGVVAQGTGNKLFLEGTNTEDAAFQGFSSINAASGSKWTLTGKFQPTGNLAVNVDGAGATPAQLTMNGVISGAGSLTADGGGTLALGATNTYAGGTTIRNGTTVQIGTAGALGSGTVTLDGGKLAATSSLSLTNSLAFAAGQRSTVTAATGRTLDIDGNLALNGSATAVFGSTTETGTVRLDDGTTIVSSTAAVVVAGGTLQVADATRAATIFPNVASTTVNTGATLDLNGYNVTIGNLQGAGTLKTRTGNFPAQTTTVQSGNFSGSITGTGQLVKTTAGTLVLSGANSYTGNTTISGGTLQLGDGGTTGSIDNSNITNNAALVFNRSNAMNFTRTISGSGSVTQSGTGTLTLSGANTYGGGTRVNSGTLQVAAANALGSGGLTMAGGKLAATSTMNLSNGVSFAAGTASTVAAATNRTLTLGGALNLGANATATFGSATETGVVNVASNSATVDSSAAVVVAGGTLRVGSGTLMSGVLGNIASTTVNGGATLDLNGQNVSIRNIQGAGTLQTGFKSAQATTITSGLFGGAIAGAGKLVKSGAGTLTLTGTNTYGGGTTIDAGTLQVGNGGTTGSISGDIVDNGVLQFNRSDDIAYAGGITGTGSLTKSGAGKLTLTGTSTYGGGTTIDAGTLQVGNGGTKGSIAGNITNNAALVFNRSDSYTVAGDIDGTGSLSDNGTGTLILAGTNSYSGGTTIGKGATLQVGNGGKSGTLSGAVTANGNLVFDRSDDSSFTGTVSGAGSLTKNGAGELEITGANTYTGNTSVNGGTLRVNNTSGSATGTGSVQVGAGATLAGGGTISGAVNVASGGSLAPGNSPGTLTIGDLSMDKGSFLNYHLGAVGEDPLNDLVQVNGNLVLGGTLNVTETAGGSFGPGLYRLVKYTGSLTDNGLNIGNTPVTPGDLYVQTSVAKEVNLINSTGVQLGFWDGGDTVNNGSVGGGSGTWRIGSPGSPNDTWTNSEGGYNATWKPNQFAMFGGTAGTVTVDNSGGDISIGGAQFFSDGYVVQGDALTLGNAHTVVKVGDGTRSGASMTATIASQLTGAGGLTKDDYGTLVLTGANNYTGGTVVAAGVLQGNTTSLQGEIVNNATVTFDQSTDGTFGGTMSGSGSLRKIGTGDLALATANTYAGGTSIDAGSVSASVSGALGTGPVNVNASGYLAFTGNAGAGDLRFTTAAASPGINGGAIEFRDDTSAERASFLNYKGGSVTFAGNSTAGDAVFDNRGGSVTVWNNATAGNARIVNSAGGSTNIWDDGSAGRATIVNEATASLDIRDRATAAQATVVNKTGAVVNIRGLTTAGTSIGSLEGGGRVLLGSKTLTTGGLNTSTEISGVISGVGGSLVKEGTGTLTLSGANTYTGGTALLKGRLNLGNAQALGTGELAMDDGTAIGFTAPGMTIANAIRFTGNSDPIIDTGAFDAGLSGAISGAGFITKIGTGTLTLSGANSYTGATDVAQGTLRAGAANTFSAASAHNVAAGATLDLAGYSQTVASLSNSGTVSLVGTVPGTTLTVNGAYVGNGGVLKLGTTLYFNGPPSDRLILNGPAASASGNTTVQITNIGGLGALTNGNGIEVITAQNGAKTTAQTTKDAFSLAGGHVDAGAFEYRLYAADALGQGENWYLRSAQKGVTYYRPETSLYAALPNQLRQGSLAMLGDVRKRVGDDDVKGTAPSATGSERRAWARVLSTDIDIQQGGTVSPTSKGRLTGFQAGTDLLATPNWRAGIYVGQLDGDARVSGYASGVSNLSVGRNDLRSQYVGVYGTYTSDSGFYADAVVQSGRHRYTVEPLMGIGAAGKGNSLLGSIEVGQAFPIGASGWTVEPQLQLIHQHMDLSNSAILGAVVQPQVDSGWLARAGVRVKGEIDTGMGMLQPYGRVNVYKTSRGTDVARFVNGATSTDIAAPIGGTSTELAGGFTLTLNPSTSLYGEIGKLWSSGGDTKVRSGINGSLGVRVKW